LRCGAAVYDFPQNAGRQRAFAVIGQNDDIGAIRRIDRGF
jgi:hypothetical protein